MLRVLAVVTLLSGACGARSATGIDAGDDDAARAIDAALDAPDPSGPVAFAAAPASLTFGSVAVGTSSPDVSLTVTNTGGTVSAPITAVISGGGGFAVVHDSCAPGIRPNAGCIVQVRFTPAQTGLATATLTISDAVASVGVPLSGTGIAAAGLRITPSVQDFGPVPVGTTAGASLTVTNTGGSTSGALSVAKSGANAGEFGASGCSGATLAPNATCTITVSFTPGAAGSRTASVDIAGTPGGTASATLFGSGVVGNALTITPAPYNFGSVRLGDTSFAHQFTVTHTGPGTTGPLVIAKQGQHVGDFILQGNGCASTSLGPGAACTLFVTFEPGDVGARTATLSASASPGGSVTSNLSGTCTAN